MSSGQGTYCRKVDHFTVRLPISEQISTPETRWRGSNFGAYSNPQMDQLYDRFQVALATTQLRTLLLQPFLALLRFGSRLFPWFP